MAEKVRGTVNLVEILVIILVVGIFMTLIVPKLGFERRMTEKCKENMLLLAQAESLYFQSNGAYTDDFEDLGEYLSDIEEVKYSPYDSALYILKLKKDTLTVDSTIPDSLMYELNFTDTTRTEYIEINPQSYILQSVTGDRAIISGKPNWETK